MKKITIKKESTRIESVEGKIIHPALDIMNGILTIGFRYRSTVKEEKEIILFCKEGAIGLTSADSVQIKEDYYFFEKKHRKLMRIEDRWSLNELQDFVDRYLHGKEAAPKPKEVIAKIVELTKKYIELEKEVDYLLVSAWAIGTYFFPIFYAYPFLNIKAPKKSGKSQCLNFLRQICFNAVKARPTLAALGDTVDSLRGTYLIDQSDSLSRKGGEELLDILADSYKKGGGKRRTINFNKGKQREVLEFETYSPKVFASIKELPEDLRDRCLIVPLIRSSKNFYDPDDDNENWKKIRGMMYRFLVDVYGFVDTQYYILKSEYRNNPTLVGRELELWLPLEVMLKITGVEGTKIEEAQKRFLAWYGFAEYIPSELEEEVAKVILEQFGNLDRIVLSPKEISEKIDPELFPDFDQKQRASKIGWIIKKFNLSSGKEPRSSKGVSYSFEKDKVNKIYGSYFEKNHTHHTSAPENKSDSG